MRSSTVCGLAVSLFALAAATSAPAPKPQPPRSLRRLVALGLPVYCGAGKGPYVALTFDDGPTRWTPKLLRVLRENGARATFFEIGRNAYRRPDLVGLEERLGTVGTHSWSHPSLPGLDPRRIAGELRRGRWAVERATRRRVRLFRPPFGAHDPTVDRMAKRLGLLEVLWNVDSGDASEASTPGSDEIAGNLAARVRPGAIVLLHEDETVPRTIDALRAFLPELARRGLHAVTVPELLRRDRPPPEQVAKGSGGCHSSWHRQTR